jgi:MoaA/NifB/PqqE/SkfB family radical SAM enzyme
MRNSILEEAHPYFTLRVGFSCNNACIHCFVEKKKSVSDLTEENLKATIDTIKKGMVVCFTGGEPTVRDDFLRLLQYSKSKGFANAVQTNGVKFSDTIYFKTIEPYLDSVTLPIHSSDMDIFDKITQKPGSGVKTIAGLKNIVNSRIRYNSNIQIVINQLNYKTLLDTFDMIQDISPGMRMTLTFPHPIGAAHSIDVVPRYSEVKDYIQPVLNKYGRLMHTHYIPRCYLYPYQDMVANVDLHDNGSVRKPGTDYTEKWENIDYGVLIRQSRIKTTDCKKCIFDKDCIGVWKEYGELYSEPDLVPVVQI